MTTGTDGVRADTPPAARRRVAPWVRPQHLTRSVAWGAVALVVVLLAGGTFLATRRGEWTAETTAMVVPDQALDPAAGAGYYETLSRGHVVATVAEILRLGHFRDEAATGLGITPEQRDSVTVEVAVVPNTAIITIAATAPDARLAEQMADAVLARATAYEGLPEPYELTPVSGAAGTARQAAVATWRFAAVLLLIALVAGVAAQQAAYHLAAAANAGGTAARPARNGADDGGERSP
jgi:hypothetical protein